MIVLVTGGAAAGKSSYAAMRASRLGPNVLFVATCEPRDGEMREKIARHRADRPPSWTVVEEPWRPDRALRAGFDAAIVDCLTLLVSQHLVAGRSEPEILETVSALCSFDACDLFLVTNEVGSGLVPDAPLGRRFREIAGRANRLAAERASEVVLMVSGIPVPIKGGAP